MAKYKVSAIANSGAFQAIMDEIVEMELRNTETKVVDHEMEQVEHYDLITTMCVDRQLDLSEGVLQYTEYCEICGAELEEDYLETDTGSVCKQCQDEAEALEEEDRRACSPKLTR